jgi:hypothetical protein
MACWAEEVHNELCMRRVDDPAWLEAYIKAVQTAASQCNKHIHTTLAAARVASEHNTASELPNVRNCQQWRLLHQQPPPTTNKTAGS